MFCFDILFPASQPERKWDTVRTEPPTLKDRITLYYSMMGKKHLPGVVTVRYVLKRPNKAGERRK